MELGQIQCNISVMRVGLLCDSCVDTRMALLRSIRRNFVMAAATMGCLVSGVYASRPEMTGLQLEQRMSSALVKANSYRWELRETTAGPMQSSVSLHLMEDVSRSALIHCTC